MAKWFNTAACSARLPSWPARIVKMYFGMPGPNLQITADLKHDLTACK